MILRRGRGEESLGVGNGQRKTYEGESKAEDTDQTMERQQERTIRKQRYKKMNNRCKILRKR